MPQFDSNFFSSLIFWEIISFGILLWILYKYAFPPILETLEIREKKIRESIEQAEKNRAESEQRLQTYEAKLHDAAREAEGIINEARDQAQRLLDDNQQRIRVETDRLKTEASQEIDRERRKALQDIRNETADLALQVAEKILARNLSDDDHRRFAQEALDAVAPHQTNGHGKG
ncbi:MAG: ATP synthase subunit b [Nitrospirales bacterium]|nr:MAG: ATP synthase subunit b [Nitrospirales bacterium]